MALRLSLACLALATATFALACSSADDVASSESNHTEGQPTAATHPWLWANESIEDFRYQNQVVDLLPQGHALTQRLQFWVDRMDAYLRTRFPEKLANTPRPVVVIEDSPDFNAWVSTVPVAWKVPTRIATDSPTPEAPPALMLLGDGIVMSLPSPGLPQTHTKEGLASFVDFFNGSFQSCKLTNEGGTIHFGEGCLAAQVGSGASSQLAYLATAKHVTITTEYLRVVGTEERAVACLAHELGHFYGAHGTIPTDLFNYFYSLDENVPEQPKVDPRFVAQTAALRDKVRLRRVVALDFSDENVLMQKERLGVYTDEQAADEISLEIMAHIGLAPEIAVDDNIAILAWTEQQGARSDGLTASECSSLRAKGFKDEAGKWISVPVGDASDAHHTLCFRAFNVAREIEAHAYVVAERIEAPGGDWATLLATLP